MAKCTKAAEPTPRIPLAEYTLILNQDEAAALSSVIARVAGIPKTSARGHIYNIERALEEAGVAHHDSALNFYDKFAVGRIEFKEGPVNNLEDKTDG